MFKKAEWLAIAKDRTAIILLIAAVVEVGIIIITTLVRLHSSDVQVPVRYTGYGSANIYRGQWFTIWQFAIFAVMITAINNFLAIKIYQMSKMAGRGIMSFTVFVLLTGIFVLNAIFNLTPSV